MKRTEKNPKGAGRKPKEKPSLEKFRELSKTLIGNKTRIAESLGVCYNTVDKWCKEDEDFNNLIIHQTERRLDLYLETAHLLALGVPTVENGKVIGWSVPPDPATLRFMIEKYGARRGFGDKLDITTNGENISSNVVVEIIDKREDVENTDN